MPTISVSDRTMSRIEARAIPFKDQSPEDVIERLLDKTEQDDSGSQDSRSSGADLVTRGGRIPHGSKLRATYKGSEYHARVDDGKIVWNGQRFDSPSKAAIAVIQSTGTDRQAENGWRFWEVQTPGSGKWRPAKSLQTSKKQNGQDVVDRFFQLPEAEQEKKLEELKQLTKEFEDRSQDADEGSDSEVYFCKGRDGADATAEYKNDMLVVKQGSEAALECTNGAGRAKTIREDLKDKGVLKLNDEGTALVFTRDEAFSSPSPAAQAVLGRSANGWDEWKTSDGRTLDQIERW